MARVLGQALWMLALFAAYIYMARGMGLTQSGAWGVAALACPFGAWYFWYGAYSGFYLPNMILILFSLGAVLRVPQPKAGVRRAVQWAILAVVCFAAGLSSMKTLMAMFLPLPVAAAAMAAREFRKNGAFGETKRLLIVSVIASAIAFFGYLINAAVLTKRYSYIGSGVEMFSAFGIDDFLFLSISALFCAVRLSGGQLLGHEYPRAVDSRRAWRVWHPDGAGDCGFAGSAAQARGCAQRSRAACAGAVFVDDSGRGNDFHCDRRLGERGLLAARRAVCISGVAARGGNGARKAAANSKNRGARALRLPVCNERDERVYSVPPVECERMSA